MNPISICFEKISALNPAAQSFEFKFQIEKFHHLIPNKFLEIRISKTKRVSCW
jgi:hypothetical protein